MSASFFSRLASEASLNVDLINNCKDQTTVNIMAHASLIHLGPFRPSIIELQQYTQSIQIQLQYKQQSIN